MKSFLFILILAMFLLPATCFSQGEQGEFVYSENNSIEVLDPYTYSANARNDRLTDLLYGSLFSFDKTPKPVPDMVEKFEAAPSKPNTYILTLHQGMKWADGQEVTVDDVLKTVDIIRNQKTQLNSDPYYRSRLMTIRNIQRLDKYRFQVTFNDNYSTSQWQSILRFPILPKKAIGNLDGLTRRNSPGSPNGCGPFYFRKFIGETVELRKNPDYHRLLTIMNPHPIQTLLMISNSDDITRVKQFQDGRSDMLVQVPWQSIPDIDAQSSQFQTQSYEALSYHYIGFNFRNEFLRIPAVREAIAKAIDRLSILKKIYYNNGSRTNGPFPLSSPYCDPTVPYEPFDPQAAKELLSGAGISERSSEGMLRYHGKPLKLRLVYERQIGSEGDANHAVCQFIQGDLREIGIEIELEPQQSLGLYEDKLFLKHDFDLSFASWRFGDITGDPSTLFVSSDTVNNYIHYSNPKSETLFGNFERTLDENSRKEIGWDIHRELAKDHPYVFLWSLNNLTAYNWKKIKHVSINPYSFFDSICEWQVLDK